MAITALALGALLGSLLIRSLGGNPNPPKSPLKTPTATMRPTGSPAVTASPSPSATPAPTTAPAPKISPKASSTGGGGTNTGGNDTHGPAGGGNSGNSCALPNYPTASCTGVPTGTALATINSDVTISITGYILENKNVNGCVIVQAANVIIRKSKITCTSFYAIASYAASDDGGLVVEDVEIDCANHNSTGISYQGLTVRRANIHNCENGLDAYRDVTLVDSYIHDIYEGATGHGDGLQSANGSNLTITHNTIYANNTTSAININNSSGGPTTTNTTISYNLLAGGAYTLYCPIPASVNFKILSNRFSRLFYPNGGTYGPQADCQDESQTTGNVWHDTGQAVSF